MSSWGKAKRVGEEVAFIPFVGFGDQNNRVKGVMGFIGKLSVLVPK